MRGWTVGAVLLAVACREAPPARERAVVFASASLSAAFEALGREFERLHPGAQIELHVAGTPRLVLQVREGAPVDVFASADEPNMARVVATGMTLAEPVVFARNHLTIVTPPGNPEGVRGLPDLARADLRVVLCAPEVPAGRYARQALERAGVGVTSLSDEPSVQAVLSKVRLGEVDAGIVFVTDAGDGVEAVPIAREHDVVGTCPIVLLDAGGGPAVGRAFVDFVRSPAGQDLLRRYGFADP